MTGALRKAWLAYRQGIFLTKLRPYLRPYVAGLRYLVHDPSRGSIELHAPGYVQPSTDPAEKALVERIFRSYKAMKAAHDSVPALYRPASIWQEHLDRSYAHMLDALRRDDVDTFHYFLANFGTWDRYIGIESTTLLKTYAAAPFKRGYLKNVLFGRQLANWKWLYGGRKPVAALSYPLHGNQAGAYIEGSFVGLGSFSNEVYGALLGGLLADRRRPVVADLGAGYGKLAYFTLREAREFCFVDFDLPEPLCLAAYYLMKTWPEKRALLYGEAPYGADAHDRYDLVFMPAQEIAAVSARSVDLFVNKNSLGEMTAAAAANYVGHIARAADYFFHMNHEHYANVYADGTRGLLGYEYPVPPESFKLVFRYPDVGLMTAGGYLDYGMDVFAYLYARRASPASSVPV